MSHPVQMAKDYKAYVGEPYAVDARGERISLINVEKIVKNAEAAPKQYKRKEYGTYVDTGYPNFYKMKQRNLDMYDRIYNLGNGDLKKGYDIYEMYRKRIVQEVMVIEKLLRKKRLICECSQALYETNTSLSTAVNRIVDSGEIKTHKVLEKMEEMIIWYRERF